MRPSTSAQLPACPCNLHLKGGRDGATGTWPPRRSPRIEAARAEGLDVTVDVYPYHFSSTSLLAVIPPWALDGGVPDLVPASPTPPRGKRS